MRRRYKLLKQPADVENMEGFDLTGISDTDLIQWDVALEAFVPLPITSLVLDATQITGLGEASQDATAALIQNGTGISWSYNDGLNTLTPTVTLAPFTTTNLAEGANLYYTDERAQDAVGAAVANSARVTLTYSDATPSYTADLVLASIGNTYLANMAQSRIKGRAEGAGTGDPTDLTPAQVAAIIDGEAITWSAAQTYTLVITANGGVDARGSVPFLRVTETDRPNDEQVWRWDTNGGISRFRAYNDALNLNAIAIAWTRGSGSTPSITDCSYGNATDNPTHSFLGTGTTTFGGQATALRFVPTSSTAATNGLYLSAANTPAISSNSTLAMSWDSSQNALGKAAIRSDSATAGVGYATGAGGTVTQATSRTTGVTLNKICGAITLFSAAGTTSWQSFTVTNSAVAATDVVKVCQKSGTDKNMIHVTAVGAGSFEITFATTGGTTVEQPVFNFTVIKAVAA